MKKSLVFFATMAVLLAGTASYISAQHDIIMDAGNPGGGSYRPESCTSSTSCMTHYTDKVMPYSGNIYCCSKNEQGVTGKVRL